VRHSLSNACQPLWSKKSAERDRSNFIESVYSLWSALQKSLTSTAHSVMMDPASIMGIVGASGTIIACIGGTIKELNDVRGKLGVKMSVYCW